MNRLRPVRRSLAVGLTLLAAACGGGGGGSTPPVQTEKALVWGSGTWGQRWSATLPVTLAADDTSSSDTPSPSPTSSTDDLARPEIRR